MAITVSNAVAMTAVAIPDRSTESGDSDNHKLSTAKTQPMAAQITTLRLVLEHICIGFGHACIQ
jgi:hypothetical protein